MWDVFVCISGILSLTTISSLWKYPGIEPPRPVPGSVTLMIPPWPRVLLDTVTDPCSSTGHSMTSVEKWSVFVVSVIKRCATIRWYTWAITYSCMTRLRVLFKRSFCLLSQSRLCNTSCNCSRVLLLIYLTIIFSQTNLTQILQR